MAGGFKKLTRKPNGNLFLGKERFTRGHYYVQFPDGTDNLYIITIRRHLAYFSIQGAHFTEKVIIRTALHGIKVDLDVTTKCKFAKFEGFGQFEDDFGQLKEKANE